MIFKISIKLANQSVRFGHTPDLRWYVLTLICKFKSMWCFFEGIHHNLQEILYTFFETLCDNFKFVVIMCATDNMFKTLRLMFL